MRTLLRALGFVVAGVVLTAVIGNVRHTRSETRLAAALSRDEVCRQHMTALTDATLRGDRGARERLLRDLPEECARGLRL